MNENFKYSEWRKQKNIKRYVIPNVENYFEDLKNIENSFSDRVDVPLSYTFIMESAQLIVNSISLFELGYFDSAYYSLREAIEISTTIVYLSDMPDKDRQEKMEAWINTKYFPVQKKMLNQLYQHGTVVSNMKDKMKYFFEEIETISEKINKIIHKQGLRYFYVSRNNPFNIKKYDNVFIKNFIYFLEKTIGIVAIMRLAIDPFPVLLMDEEILLRCFDSMTEPYNNEFLTKYISDKILEDYKKTEIYVSHYNTFISNVKKNYAVFDIMKWQFIDTTKKDEIFSQINLLNDMHKIVTYIALSSKKVARIYIYDGIIMYFTDRKTNRKEDSWNSLEIKKFGENNEKVNQKYGESFISVFKCKIEENKYENFFVEHNVPLDDNEIMVLSEISIGTIFKF